MVEGGLAAVSEMKQGIPLNRQRATAKGFSNQPEKPGTGKRRISRVNLAPKMTKDREE